MDDQRNYTGGRVPPTTHHPPVQPFYYQQGYGYQPPQQERQNPLAGFADGAQKLTPGGFQPLNREERKEAERIAMEANFSYDGYQVARREFFSHKYDPTLTFKGNSITFNNACITSLDGVVYIQVLVNPDEKKMVIRPCQEGARDAIRWCVTKTDKRKSRQITCNIFAAKMYTMMNWEKMYYYKLQGTRITYDGQEIYVFDLTSQEPYPPAVQSSDNPNAKKKARKAVYPADWLESFGLDVDEHDASTRVDLMQGYGLEGVNKALIDADAEQMSIGTVEYATGEVLK